MTTSRNNTIMSWMAYTEFFYPGCELQPGYFYLSIPELYYIPEDGACIGAVGVDAYIGTSWNLILTWPIERCAKTSTSKLELVDVFMLSLESSAKAEQIATR